MKSILSLILTLPLVFTCMCATTVSAEETNETIRIEYEALAMHVNGETSPDVLGASDGKVLNCYSYALEAAPEYRTDITFTQSAYYTMEFVSNIKPADDVYEYSPITFALYNGISYPLPVSNQKTAGVLVDYSADKKVLNKFKYENIWIDAGTYSFETVIAAVPGNGYKYQLDYFEFSFSHIPEISQSHVTKIETDKFAGVGVYSWDRGVTENKNASEGQLVFQKGGIVDPSWSIPVKVTQSGFYHVSYTTGDCTNKSYLSTVQLKLGSVILGENKTTAADKSVNLNVGAWEGTQYLYQYTNEWIWLDKGEYDITVHISITSDQFYKFQMDDITFVPAVNGISRDDDGTIKVHATYTEVKTGFLILAAYNGDTLVGTTTYHMDNEDFVDFAYQTDKPVTKVKVFIWENNSSVKPLEMYKDFTIS